MRYKGNQVTEDNKRYFSAGQFTAAMLAKFKKLPPKEQYIILCKTFGKEWADQELAKWASQSKVKKLWYRFKFRIGLE